MHTDDDLWEDVLLIWRQQNIDEVTLLGNAKEVMAWHTSEKQASSQIDTDDVPEIKIDFVWVDPTLEKIK